MRKVMRKRGQRKAEVEQCLDVAVADLDARVEMIQALIPMVISDN